MVFEYDRAPGSDESRAAGLSEARIFGILAGVMGGKSEHELMALADRLESWAGGLDK